MSKDCLSREKNIIFPTLRSCQKQFFAKWFKQSKKFSFFGKGTAQWMFCIHLCRVHLLWAFAAGILWKTQPWNIFARVLTVKCIASCMMALWKISTVLHSSSWNFSSPHYVTYFVCQRLQKFMKKVTLKVLFHEVSWENTHFCGLKKETFISYGRKWVNSSKKYVKFFSSVHYFPSYISPLMSCIGPSSMSIKQSYINPNLWPKWSIYTENTNLKFHTSSKIIREWK